MRKRDIRLEKCILVCVLASLRVDYMYLHVTCVFLTHQKECNYSEINH